jgi:ABC-type nitrate/sulfonate/bicarbonate transport system substrate-binding protein
LPPSNITTPDGLKGKQVADSPSTSEHFLFPAFLAANGMGEGDVTRVAATPSSVISLLLSGKVDAINNYLQVAAAMGGKVNAIPWYEHGVDGYGTVVIANRDYLKDNAKAVKAVLHSMFQGLRDVIADPRAAGEATAKAADAPSDFFIEEVGLLKPLWTVAGGRYGEMAEARWQATEDLNVKYAGQAKRVKVADVFTNRYLS